jgi:predicted heme/steroid binding protein
VLLLWWGDLLPFSNQIMPSTTINTQKIRKEIPRVSQPRRYTVEELAQYDGRDPSKPLLLAIMGRVYDVTKGWDKYGPGASYHFFVGKDATRSFITYTCIY